VSGNGALASSPAGPAASRRRTANPSTSLETRDLRKPPIRRRGRRRASRRDAGVPRATTGYRPCLFGGSTARRN